MLILAMTKLAAFVFASLAAMTVACAPVPNVAANRCANYGYSPGTEAFAGCMERADDRREQQRRALQNTMWTAAILSTYR